MRHGSRIDPKNRFESVHLHPEDDDLEWDTEYRESRFDRKIEYLPDESKTIVSQNDSPDLSFRVSVNPYRGCAHGCSYCYARPTHEFLGLNAGLDFETKIMVKHDAPKLFREFLARSSWEPELIAFSGVTDCYQPAEREFRLTRGCLEVAREANQPIGIVTKNALVARDIDLLAPMAALSLVRVNLSITTLDRELASAMEPRTSTPAARLRAIKALTSAGIATRVMVSPIIPGLNDSEIPAILQAAKDAGATSASCILLRLPLTVEPVFLEWLERTRPEQKDKVLNRIRQCRGGKLNESGFKKRMRGEGEIADQIHNMFKVFRTKLGMNQSFPEPNCDAFVRPQTTSGQMSLF